MKVESVKTSDNQSLKYAYVKSDASKPWIVFIIPFALKTDLAKPFFDFFSGHYNIVTWESRLILDEVEEKPEPQFFNVEYQVQDLLDVMAALEIKQAHLVGYCSGAGIALCAINRAPDRFEHLVLAHGEYTLLGESSCTTQFALDMDGLLSLAASSETRAKLVFDKIQSERMDTDPNRPDGLDLPFSQLHYLTKYADTYTAYKSEDFTQLAKQVGHKTLVLTGERDIQANVNSSQRIQDLIDHSEIYVDPTGDHYGVLRPNSKTLVKIWNYLCVHKS